MGFSPCRREVLGIEDHIFQFSTAKLCPTIGDFSTIMDYELGKKSIVVSCDPKHKGILSDALGLSTLVTSSMIEGHMVNLHVVFTRIIDRRTHGLFDNMQKKFGLALCIMGEFLLYFGRPDLVDA